MAQSARLSRNGGLALLLLALGAASCGGPGAPDEPPRGQRDATILTNVALFRALQQATHPGSVLVALGGISPPGGTTCPDGYWWYRFARPATYKLDDWSIACDGQFSVERDVVNTLHNNTTEVASLLVADSTDLIRIAREHGAQQYLDRFPNARVLFLGRFVDARAVWEVSFETNGTPCGFRVVIDGPTAQVLQATQPCP